MRLRVAFVLFLSATVSSAGEPVVRTLNLHGLQVGGRATITIDGDELGKAPRLLLPFECKQELKPKSTDKQATFEIAVPEKVPAGYYHLRVVTEQGVSLPVIIGVDRLPQKPITPTTDMLPVALHGNVAGGAIVETKFAGKAGQKLLVEVDAQRLGSKLRPVLHLIGPKGLQLAWSWPTVARSGDARLEATLTDDGLHTIAIHDAEYAAVAPSFFRLRVGSWSFVDNVMPLAQKAGSRVKVTSYVGDSEWPGETSAAADRTEQPLAWPSKGLMWSGPQPVLRLSPHAEIEEDPKATPTGQELAAIPIGVSGRLAKPYEEDRYRLKVTPGMKLKFEVFAERYGSPIDTAIILRNEAGAQIARADDSPGSSDPVLEFAVPDKMTTLIVGVVDVQGRGGPRAVYRLVVEPSAAMPDFRLVATAPRLSPAADGFAVLPVQIERRGYRGPVELSATDLPAGLKLEGNQIPAGADGALVMVHRKSSDPAAAITRWTGKGGHGETHTLVIKGHPLERLQPWLATEVAVAPTTAKAADFQVAWRSLPENATLVPSKKLTLPIHLTRPDDKLPVKLTLVTSQSAPIVNNQPDPNQAIRVEKAVELGAKMNDGELSVLVPAGVSGPVYDVTVLAELLSADKKTVLAAAYAPVRRMMVQPPVVVKLDGPTRIETTLDAKKETAIKLKGEIERREGLAGDVALAITGLPAGARADAVTVKAGATAFTANVYLPVATPPGEIRGVVLSGSAVADPKTPNVRVKSREVELTLVVKATK
jgi:hypothetical protein